MIWIIILGLIAGYREVQILCDRGSWYYLNFRKLFWFTNQADKRASIWDSFHVSNGIYVLVLCAAFFAFDLTLLNFLPFPQALNTIVQVVALWWVYMWARNIMMHIIMPYKPKWKYLSPIQF